MSTHEFTAPTMEELARLLPAYDFEMLIAKGGMGAVYRAKQRSLARDVAVKVLPREFGLDPMFRQSFETEARAMARLNHPNLIGVYDSGAVDDMLYIVMEYVPGKSLYHSSYGKQVDPKQAVELIRGICAGLGHAHENGIIHRDIKPANVLLTPKAEPKIGDFGLARPVEEKGVGLVMGTPGYTAPEVLSNPLVADCRSDLFAVGVMLYELLTGQRQTADARPPSTLCSCGAGMDDIWRRAVHPEAAKRFQDAASLKAALGRWLEGYQRAKTKAKPTLLTAAAPASAAARPVVGGEGDVVAGGVKQVQIEVKTNWHFIRNLFIIAVLIVLIAIAWKTLERARRAREADEIWQRSQQVEKEAKQAAEAKKVALELQRKREEEQRLAAIQKTDPPPEPTPVVPPEQPKPETPLESLVRLRLDLVNGKRDEMPIGVTRRADCDFMMVPTPMTWADAAWYAERFGGHLPTPGSSEEITWLERQAPGEAYIWLGAGRSSRDDWTMLDGKRWSVSPAPKGLGTFVGVGKLGMKTFDGKTRQPFVIQWHRDGANPASLAAALQVARESLGEANPVYPPGTVAFDSRHFLYVSRPVSWRDAVDMAERSGGHLAVVSNSLEAAHLQQFADAQVAVDGIWLGGFLKGADWLTITGEPWTVSKWANGVAPAEGNLALLIRPVTGWDALNLSMVASGFIIEWSGDRHRRPEPAVSSMNTSSGSVLAAKAKELILAADSKRLEQFSSNAKTFGWDLDVWLRGLSGNDRESWELHVAKLKRKVRNFRVPTIIPENAGIKMSPKMAEIALNASRKQEKINAGFLAEVDKIRQAYQAKLKAEVIAAENAGKIELGASLRKEYKSADDSGQWLQSFGINPAVGASVPAAAPDDE
ncbi:MAG: protein kinase [Akkermansiaceae bacterium]|nr:protein kinase [Akkermansiaceae bacterium]